MSWTDRRARLLGKAPVMSVDDVFATLLERDAMLCVTDGQLRYVGPGHGDSDPLQAAINAHRAELIELFTYAPAGRCVFTDCYRLRGTGDKIACADHRAEMDRQP